jgi:flagellar hook protein FlgE
MLDSILSGLSGLIAFSKGLTNISNNVANLNTPGYKARQLQFSDLFYHLDPGIGSNGSTSPFANGSGVEAGSERLSSTQGDFRTTGNDLDIAIDGNGFIVFNRQGEDFYTRAGQFEFDEAGYLVIRGSNDRVQFLSGGNLVDLNIDGRRTNPPKITTRVSFVDTLNVTQPVPPYSTTATVIDSLGNSHTLTLTFISAAPGWTVNVTEGATSIGSGTIQYDGSGDPVSGLESFDLNYDPAGAAKPMTISFDFSASDSLSTAGSTLRMGSQDGIATGALTRATFTEDGVIVFSYSNGQQVTGPTLALASFNNISALEPIGDSAFANRSGQERILGMPNQSVFGTLRGGGVEASNVDLAAQFSELIITQRGYQASSQIITAANEMIQQLLEMRGRQ